MTRSEDNPRDADHRYQHGVRLQKVLAAAGLASRRAAEVLIEQGRVEVNGRLVLEQGLRVDPASDVIRVDGSRIPPPRRHVYLALNKPRGYVSTLDDPEGRRNLTDLLAQSKNRVAQRERLFHVGRLDTDTEGLLLVTNDGELGHKLAHPSFEVPKVYLAEVEGVVSPATLKRLRKGIKLDDGWVTPDAVKLVSTAADRSLVRLTLREGRNRIVRRTMDAVGHPVRRLSRTAIGPIRLGSLPLGQTRELTREELGALLDLVESGN
ncbi:MAG: rRNA pseudouridine synthase [Microlunatus sp.]|nr:rRNA pseudouridine synthase [Microlunatus sp.]MDN5771200.1 rRNA pseudouridine synthase [Microlunatus sp.]